MPDRRIIVRSWTRSKRQRVTLWHADGTCIIVEGGHTPAGKPCLVVDLPDGVAMASETVAVDRPVASKPESPAD